MDIKPIETNYKGYRFRSRLEARWAVFLDALDIKWEYEKEGFELPSGRYLPDFWLQDWKIWLEIKPEKPTEEEQQKAIELCELSGYAVLISEGLPKLEMQGRCFCYSLRDPGLLPDDSQGVFDGDNWEDFKSEAEYIANNLCRYTIKPKIFMFAFSEGRKDAFRDVWLHVTGGRGSLLYYKNKEFYSYPYRQPLCYSSYDGEWYEDLYIYEYYTKKIAMAINKAKSARFEHGECG